MQLRLYASAIIFVGSYFPLSLILLVQDINYSVLKSAQHLGGMDGRHFAALLQNPRISIAITLFSFGCFIVSMVALRQAKPKPLIKVTDAEYIPADLMNYTLPYVVSFMSFSYQETGKFVGILIFLVWMFLISHRSGQVMLNPLLIVFKWRYYKLNYVFLTENKERTGHALSKDVLEPGMFCEHSTIQDIIVLKEYSKGT